MIGAGIGMVIGSGVVCVLMAVLVGKDRRSRTAGETEHLAWRTRLRSLANVPAVWLAPGTAAVAAAALTMVVTGWIGAAVGVGAVAAVVTSALEGGGTGRSYAAKCEGIATWIETLRDLVATGYGVEHAVIESAKTAPDELVEILSELRVDVEHGKSVRSAVIDLADRVDVDAADTAISMVVMTLDGLAPNPVEPLDKIAMTMRRRASRILEIDAERAGQATTMKMMMLVLALLVGGLFVFARGFLEPYGEPGGQVVLLGVFGVIVGGFVWMRKAMTFKSRTRFITAGAMATHDGHSL